MPLESATYVNDLVTTNPTGSDQKSEGDDHIRLLKTALKATFLNANFALDLSKVYYAGGADVAIADGGTGASTAAAGLAALGGASLTANNNFTGQQQYGTFSAVGATDGTRLITGRWQSSASVTTGTNHMEFYNPNGLVGRIITGGSTTTYAESSDAALKDNIVSADTEEMRSAVRAGRAVEFEFKSEPGVKRLGFIAQEMYAVVLMLSFPEMTTHRG
jgi:hypothetical protein